MKALALTTLLAVLASPVVGQSLEIDHQRLLCDGMMVNRHLPNGTEVDCLTDAHAIEVDFSDHWAEAIGQSLQYASALERLPGIILICRGDTKADLCLKHSYLIEQTVTYWRIGMTLWLCEATATQLADCRRVELMGPN